MGPRRGGAPALCCLAAAVAAAVAVCARNSHAFSFVGAGSWRPAARARSSRPSTSCRMMFDQLAGKLVEVSESLTGRRRISESSVSGILQEVRTALLDADVNLQVADDLVKSVKAKAVGAELIEGVKPDQQFIKYMYDELTAIMGGQQAPLARHEDGRPTVILLAGLQGAGKTTAAAKLANWCLKEETPRKVLLVAGDIYRPAAIEQLQTLGGRIGVEVFSLGREVSPVEIAGQGLKYAEENGFDTVIVDTAGRQVIDDTLMTELSAVKDATNPDEVLLVVDAMTGQEAATLTAAFNKRVGLTGAVLTKLDGDTRGGSALSVSKVSGRPIKFIGVGENIDDLEVFYPERMASRVLGQGDVVTLVEKMEKMVPQQEAEDITKKMIDGAFDFDDFIKQYRMMSGMGGMARVAKMMPGMSGKISQNQIDDAEDRIDRAQLFIAQMTPEERTNPDLFIRDSSALARIRRIAKDSGMKFQDASNFIEEFQRFRSMMTRMSKQMAGMGEEGGAAPGAADGGAAPMDMSMMGNRAQRRQAKNKKSKGGAGAKGFG
jgi:signal recognition particle subunit SRP54